MTEISVKDAKVLKVKLQDEIAKLCANFEDDTGLTIDMINIDMEVLILGARYEPKIDIHISI